MPNRRATRAKQTRPAPRVKDNCESGLTESERTSKLESYITDFDNEVECMKNIYQADLDGLLLSVKKTFFTKCRSDHTKTVLKMKLEEYFETYCNDTSIEDTDGDDMEEEEEEDMPKDQDERISVMKEMATSVMSKFGHLRAVSRIETIPEEGWSKPVPTSSRPTRKTKQNTTVRASSRLSKFVTPANQRCASTLGWNTPMITPKFDPRLPMTPSTSRRAIRGETLVSLQGSPVNPSVQFVTQDFAKEVEKENIEIPDEEDIRNFQGPETVKKLMSVFYRILKKDGN